MEYCSQYTIKVGNLLKFKYREGYSFIVEGIVGNGIVFSRC